MSRTLREAVLEALRDKSASGGKLIERFQAAGDVALPGGAVVVYGALAELARAGQIEVCASSQGEQVWGVQGDPRAVAAGPGFPPSFGLEAGDLAFLEKQVWERTRGLPAFYFEELRRVVVADADRRIFRGARLPGAAREAAEALGPVKAARRYLRRVESGKKVPARLAGGGSRRWLVVPLLLLVVVVALRLFVVGVYTIPRESVSMAPALLPAAEGGDRWVIAEFLSGYWRAPQRGEVWLFRPEGESDVYVKRAWGLEGETLSFREGDLLIDGKRLVKDRALLDEVAVPLFDLADAGDTGGGVRQTPPAHLGYRNADGSVTRRPGTCRDVIVVARVRGGTGSDAAFSLMLDDGVKRHAVTLHRNGHKGSVALSGVERHERDGSLGLPEGDAEREIWITNADGVLRVQVDGEEVARLEFRHVPKSPQVSVHATGGVELASLTVARDLHFLRTTDVAPRRIEAGTTFFLGDNSHNSRDSRQFGPIRHEYLVGRAVAVAWPLGRARLIR